MDSLTNFIIKNYDEINFLEDTHIKDIALTPISRSFITDALFTSCVFNKVKMGERSCRECI